MDVACYSILLVAVAIVGIQLTSLGPVSAQEEESTITSIAQDGQNAEDGTQLTTPASVSGQEEKGSTTTPIAQDDQNAQSGPGVFPRIASVDDTAEFANSAEVADSADGVGNGVDGVGNGVDGVGNGADANGADANGADGVGNGADANGADGVGNGAVGRAGTGTNGNDGADGGTSGEDGADPFALEIEETIS